MIFVCFVVIFEWVIRGRLILLGAGNAGVNGVPRSRVPEVASHTPIREPVVA